MSVEQWYSKIGHTEACGSATRNQVCYALSTSPFRNLLYIPNSILMAKLMLRKNPKGFEVQQFPGRARSFELLLCFTQNFSEMHAVWHAVPMQALPVTWLCHWYVHHSTPPTSDSMLPLVVIRAISSGLDSKCPRFARNNISQLFGMSCNFERYSYTYIHMETGNKICI